MREARVARASVGASFCEAWGRVCSMDFTDEPSTFARPYFTIRTGVWSINSSRKPQSAVPTDLSPAHCVQ